MQTDRPDSTLSCTKHAKRLAKIIAAQENRSVRSLVDSLLEERLKTFDPATRTVLVSAAAEPEPSAAMPIPASPESEDTPLWLAMMEELLADLPAGDGVDLTEYLNELGPYDELQVLDLDEELERLQAEMAELFP